MFFVSPWCMACSGRVPVNRHPGGSCPMSGQADRTTGSSVEELRSELADAVEDAARDFATVLRSPGPAPEVTWPALKARMLTVAMREAAARLELAEKK